MPTKGELAKIHIAVKQLGVDKYALIYDRYKVESTTKLTNSQTQDLLQHFKALGWSAKPKSKTANKHAPRRSDYIRVPRNAPHAPFKRKILVMWKAMGWTIGGLETRCKKQFGVDAFLWVTNLEQLNILARDLNGRLRAKGLDPDDL